MAYESPIEMITKDIKLQQEDYVMKAIVETGVIVDKEELIKALQYDREQYEKGFENGKSAGVNTTFIKMSEACIYHDINHSELTANGRIYFCGKGDNYYGTCFSYNCPYMREEE